MHWSNAMELIFWKQDPSISLQYPIQLDNIQMELEVCDFYKITIKHLLLQCTGFGLVLCIGQWTNFKYCYREGKNITRTHLFQHTMCSKSRASLNIIGSFLKWIQARCQWSVSAAQNWDAKVSRTAQQALLWVIWPQNIMLHSIFGKAYVCRVFPHTLPCEYHRLSHLTLFFQS